MIFTLVMKFLFWLVVDSEGERNILITYLVPLVLFDILLLIISVPLDIVLFPIEVVASLIYLLIRKGEQNDKGKR